jgi:hypothetical protein
MTEAEWLACDDPRPLLASLFARTQASRANPHRPAWTDERFRLFAIGCCRRVERALEFGDRYALDCLEIYAQGGAKEELLKARRFHRPAGAAASRGVSGVDRSDRVAVELAAARNLATSAVWTCTKTRPSQAAMAYIDAARTAATLELVDRNMSGPNRPNYEPPLPAELAAQSALLRDIFGNPFRPVAFDPRWRSDTAVSLARVMYESRDFTAMPILADALQDAGCEDEPVLTHGRDPHGVHVRGCWVVDRVLGEE